MGQQNIWLAVSGGLDSMVLLHAVMQLCAQDGLCIKGVIHVNHGIHADSDHWAKVVADQAAEYGISCVVKPVTCLPGAHLEERARVARYAAIKSIIGAEGVVVTAHHLNDQYETFLFRALRGSGVHGLTGMSEVTSVMGVKVVRPLLAVSQVILKDYAHAHGVVWVDDPSNESVAYARNEIRRQCSSLFNKSALSLTMQHLNRQSGLIKEQTTLYLKQVLIDRYTIDLDLLRQLPKGWQLEVFHYWVDQQAGVKLALERTQQVLHSFLSAAEDRQPEERVGACIIRRYRQRLTSYSYEQPPKVMLTCQREIVVPMGTIVNPERKRLRIYLGVQFPGGKKQYQKMGVAPWLRTAVPWVVVLPSHQPYLIGDKYLTDQGIVLEKMAMC